MRDAPRSANVPMRAARIASAFAIAALAAACAKTGPPGGGPIDDTPPEVIAVSPEAGATMVDTGASISIRFSEEMDRESVERLLSVGPGIQLLGLRWKGELLTASPKDSLPEGETIIVRLARGAKDYHGVASPVAFEYAFATGAAVNDGVVAGSVLRGGEPVSGVTVWLCPSPVSADSSNVVTRCGYATSTGDDGAFVVRYVEASETPYSVVAFLDSDNSGAFERATETGTVAPEAAAVLAPGDSVGGIAVPIAPPENDAETGEEGS